MTSKRRILFCGEASYLSTGFSVYSHEVIKRLYDTGKFEIAEFASYAKDGDQRAIDVPWKFYPVEPSPDNKEAQAVFHGKNTNQFGEWRFTDVLLDFRPDIVWDHRDWWMSEFQGRHPLRSNYHWSIMPTIDGEPQRDRWIDTYKQADSVFCYSQYGYDVLTRQSRGKINLCEIASPCADVNVFKPVGDKREHKNKMGFDPDSFIIGMVARNQKRKLYGDLIEMYASLLSKLKRSGKRDLAAKTYLYLHTTYPDSGFDIGRFVRENKVGSRVLMTYFCSKCHTTFPTTFKGEVTFCPNCNQYGAFAPHANAHCSREALASIYNLFDIYVQYSICLGGNESILTQDGWKAISDVKKGDFAFTHKGRFKKIINKLISPNKGNVKRVLIDSDYETLLATDNHPCYAVTKNTLNTTNKQSVREILGSKIRNGESIPEPQFVQVKDLSIGDMLGFKIDDTVNDIDKIDLAEFAKANDVILDNFIEVQSGDTYPRYIKVDQQFCKFIGLYAADGHANIKNAQIQLTYHINEDKIKNIYLQQCELMTNKKPIVTSYKDRKAEDVRCCSTLHNKAFKKWCSQKQSKKLPNWSLFLPNNNTRSILQGLFMGDGHYAKDRNTSVYVTISKILADQIKVLLRRNRINFNCHIDERLISKDNKNRQSQYRFEVPGDVASGTFVTKRNSTNSLYYKKLHLLKIKNIEQSDYDSPYVYNLEVEGDHSYTTQIGIVHNCEGYGMPCREAKACGVPVMAVNYSAMEDHANSPGGMPIRVERFFHECMIETEQKRALPDNEDCANKLMTHIKKGKNHLQKIGQQGRDHIMEIMDDTNLPRGSWDRTAKLWENHFETCDIPDRSKTWDFPEPKLIHSNGNVPNNLDNAEFVKWCCVNVYRRPDLVNTCEIHDLVKNLNCGFRQEGNGCPHCHRESRIRIGRQEIINYFTNLVGQYNQAETRRIQIVKPLETNCEIL